MDLYEVMRTTPATREFAEESVPPEVLERILDSARFAASGRNAQPWRVIVVRDAETKRRIGDLGQGAFKEYVAQLALGREPFSTGADGVWRPPEIDLAAARALGGRTDPAGAGVSYVVHVQSPSESEFLHMLLLAL